jgi:hypothetical protein
VIFNDRWEERQGSNGAWANRPWVQIPQASFFFLRTAAPCTVIVCDFPVLTLPRGHNLKPTESMEGSRTCMCKVKTHFWSTRPVRCLSPCPACHSSCRGSPLYSSFEGAYQTASFFACIEHQHGTKRSARRNAVSTFNSLNLLVSLASLCSPPAQPPISKNDLPTSYSCPSWPRPERSHLLVSAWPPFTSLRLLGPALT